MADKASIVFGAITVGVKLTKVMNEKNGTPALKTLHSECETPINEQKFCPTCDKVVSKDEISKGYVQSKNQIIALSEEEVASIKTPRSSVVELIKFVEPLQHWVERSYWVDPEPLSERSYYLLGMALSNQGLWGLGTGAVWGKERPYAIEGTEGMLTLHILHTVQELAARNPLPVPRVEKAELEMAEKLVNQWSAPLEDEDLTVVGDSLLRSLIESKIEGKEFIVPAAAVEPPPTIDLLKAMKETIAMKKNRRKKAA